MNPLKPTEERINILANLIALSAVMDEEAIGDRFDFDGKNDEDLIEPFTKWLKENYPDMTLKVNIIMAALNTHSGWKTKTEMKETFLISTASLFLSMVTGWK